MKYMLYLVLIILIASFFTGCMSVPAGLTSSITPVTKGDYTVLGPSTGKASYFSLFGVIPFGEPDYDKAINNAIKKYPGGKSLINVRSTFETLYVIVGTMHTLIVKGDVIK